MGIVASILLDEGTSIADVKTRMEISMIVKPNVMETRDALDIHFVIKENNATSIR